MSIDLLTVYFYHLKKMIVKFNLTCFFFQKPGKQESTEEEELMKHLDPLHQLIHLFSRTALTEKW